jgi:hypothetical protein
MDAIFEGDVPRVSHRSMMTGNPGGLCIPSPRSCGAQILIRVDPERLGIDKSPAGRSCWNDSGGGAGVAIAGLSHWDNFQAKGATHRGKPLSASAVSGAAASASEASPKRRRSALLDSGMSMVQQLA